jgi:hypothetical protein
MLFVSPIWLFGLIPWTALAVWMLWGKRPSAVVPFIDLWRGPVSGKYVERAVHPPPRAIVMILLAAMLAIVAASQPALRGKGGRRVTIVVDRGITMSALGRERPRFIEAAEGARIVLREALDGSAFAADEVHVVIVPDGGPRTSSLEDWTSLVSHLPPTAVDTHAALTPAVAREQLHSDLVVVITDRHAVPIGDRVVHVAPDDVPANVGIAMIAARQSPAAQLMLRLRNDSPLTRAQLVVTSGAQRIEREIDLPIRGGEADRFVDLPAVENVIHASLEAQDSLPADNEAWLVRERTWPAIEPRAAIPLGLARMVEVYSQNRPAGAGNSTRVAVVTEEKQLNEGESGVVLRSDAATRSEGMAAPVVVDHPITKNVAWETALKGAAIAPAPQGWNPIVSTGAQPIVAVREGDPRRIWVGFHSESFARSTDYVVFWTNVFDWLGQGGERFAAHTVAPLGDEWEPVALAAGAPPEAKAWPGLYKRKGDGAMRAMNAPAPRIERPIDTDWRAQLRRAAAAAVSRGGFRLAPWICLAALACLLVAGWWWPGRGLTRFSGGRTV